MNEQDGASVKHRRSRQAKMTSVQALILQRPTNFDTEAWKEYWYAQGQPWRTEPEIDAERQKYLAERRSITPNIKQGIYPFKNIKLNRADVEWLLATHENGRGPIDWTNESQRERKRLDLRGVDLQGVDLRGLPLARLYGGLDQADFMNTTEEERKGAVVNMNKANLRKAQLQNALLWQAQLQGADLVFAQLQGADLREAQLQGALLNGAKLQDAILSMAQLQRADIQGAQLQGAYLPGAGLQGAILLFSQLQRAVLTGAQLQGALLGGTQLEGADLSEAQLQDTNLIGAQLQGAKLRGVVLGNRDGVCPQLADVQWSNTNLAVVDWSQVRVLGDEHRANQEVSRPGETQDKAHELESFKRAVRANRQLAVALHDQGLNEEGAYFAYCAQRLQRVVLRRQKKFGSYLFYVFLDLLAGYGYKPLRSVIWYLIIISGFALAYYAFGHLSLFPPDAFVYSLTSFHGRGFFPGLEHRTSLHDSLVMLAALEAVIGLFIEISFIATFTQRFFGK